MAFRACIAVANEHGTPNVVGDAAVVGMALSVFLKDIHANRELGSARVAGNHHPNLL